MVTLSTHGGSCCGMRHIWQFRDEDTQAYINGLIEKIYRAGADDRLQLEVILSDRQTRENPALVDNLARLGFVYTSSWSGQHGTPVHLFLRAKSRLALSAANFYTRWTEAGGMLPHPALAGDLPTWRDTVNAPVLPQAQWVIGARVRCTLNGSVNFGRVGIITSTDYYNDRWAGGSVIYEEGARSVYYFCLENNFELLPPEQPEALPEPVRHIYRHPGSEDLAFAGAERLQPVVERRLILSQFYCVFHNTGRPSRVFSTLLEGQAAFPRATQWHERKVYSDGEIVEGPVNHG